MSEQKFEKDGPFYYSIHLDEQYSEHPLAGWVANFSSYDSAYKAARYVREDMSGFAFHYDGSDESGETWTIWRDLKEVGMLYLCRGTGEED